jgi:hypothetical protein
MCSFDSGKPITQGKRFVQKKDLGDLAIWCLNYISAIFNFGAGDSS